MIGATTTATGLRVRAERDTGQDPTEIAVTKATMAALALEHHAFHGEWNDTIQPRPILTER